MAETRENATISPADPPILNKTLEEIAVIAQKSHAKTVTEQDANKLYRQLDPTFNAHITREFNKKSGLPLPGKQHDYDHTATSNDILQQALASSNAQDKSLGRYKTYETTHQYPLDTVKSLIKATPSLQNFSLDDAVLAAGSPAQQAGIFSKYPQAPQNILLASAYTLLEYSPNELSQRHPEFYNKHQALGTSFSDLAAINIFYSAQDSQDYKNWEEQKRAHIIDRISQDPIIQQALSEIKSPLNTKNVHDIVNQYDARMRAAQQITKIYAEIYGLDTLTPDDVKLLHKSINEFSQNVTTGYSWKTRFGVKNDEAIILSYNPAWGLFLKENPETTDTAARQNFVSNLVEELEHTKDFIYTDKLVNGELPPNHPAFNHNSLVLLNTLNHFSQEKNPEYYNAQFLERTAKTTAAHITAETIKRFDNAQESGAAPAQTSSTPSNEPLTIKIIASPILFTPKQ